MKGASVRRGLLAGCRVLLTTVFLSGCEAFLRDADREVYRLVEARQRQAVGTSHDVNLGSVHAPSDITGEGGKRQEPYAFLPNPLDDKVPAAFQRPASQPAEPGPDSRPAATVPSTPPAPVATSRPSREMSLSDVLAYAFRHSREYQTAKEALYLAALNLTLERHLWTPRLFSTLKMDYENLGRITDFDQTLRAVADFGVRQRLPYGGEITASIINTLVKDARRRIVLGETGEMLLQAQLPLLRGAGPANYESRYRAERELIYQIRTFEEFRRALAVDIADDYFRLQTLRQAIVNAEYSILSLREEEQKAEALLNTGRSTRLDAQRAVQQRLAAENNRVAAIEAYETARDQLKIRIGMPVKTPIDVAYPTIAGTETEAPTSRSVEPLLEALRMPAVSQEEAIAAAMKYRLDLVNAFDRIGDAERGIEVAENALLPDLSVSGAVSMPTNPAETDFLAYQARRTNYRAGLDLDLPLDRKAERNALRAAHIARDRAAREYEELRDLVALQVRRAMRAVERQRETLRIQQMSVEIAMDRREYARVMVRQGRAESRDIVEAERDLLDARNALADAQARLNLAILQFRRDTGTLRIDDEGRWVEGQTLVEAAE